MLVLAVCALAAEPPKALDIAVTFLPDDCSVTAKTGDSIKVHYVSYA
jgi:FK506-binding protein 2